MASSLGDSTRTSLLLVIAATVAFLASACSGGQNQTGAVPDAGQWSSVGGQAGATGSGGAPARTAFNLDLDFEYTQEGITMPTGWAVSLVDLNGGKPQVLEQETAGETANYELVRSFPNLLELGHQYAIAVTTGSVLGCPEDPEAAWYEVLPEVVGDVTLERTWAFGEAYDARACDVLWQPTGLATGAYEAQGPLFVNGNAISIVVTESGRLYTRSFAVDCLDAPGNCGSTEGPAPCEPTGPVPGQPSWSMSKGGDYAIFEGSATLDAATQSITFSGVSKAWYTTLQPCCELNVDATLTRTGPVPFSYQSCP